MPITAPEARNTRQKTAIRASLAAAERPLSPTEILEAAGVTVPGISIATVYRNLTTLVDEGFLVAVNLPGEAPRYEIAGKQHHHHFQCTACGKVFELDGCEIRLSPTLPPGFRMTGHEFFLFGTCDACGSLSA